MLRKISASFLCSAFFCFLVILLSLTSCQGGNTLSPSRQESKPQIETSQPGALKRYEAFYIPEIEVYEIEGDILRRVDQKEVEGLAQNFRSKLIRQLGSKHTMFPQPARNVASIKVALSDVSSTYALMQLYPGMLVPNAMRGGATIEAKVVDSITGKDVLTFRDTRQGERQGFFSGLRKWDGVESAFDEWAMQLGGAVSR
ncbi:MAG: hypothetical protein DCC75_03895 [Proteobacteria bacterium]|nr:MAG: hypothetical protein DCC75_03895 [Pseudomonadota bacterium]